MEILRGFAPAAFTPPRPKSYDFGEVVSEADVVLTLVLADIAARPAARAVKRTQTWLINNQASGPTR